MSRGIDLKQREVINMNTGQSLGFVVDLNAEFGKGIIKNIVVAQTGKFFRSLTGKNTMEVPWEKIKVIGEDVILVDL
ncbi:MAG: YlmC/YmxH family sporulation protein [Clostridia bacterium]|nr:YlmC/YmxH family sporulation protein [Clostridia bacterium]MDD4375336.1 YlmC/YmxH family sporulation protein [Clostridia bacterium]